MKLRRRFVIFLTDDLLMPIVCGYWWDMPRAYALISGVKESDRFLSVDIALSYELDACPKTSIKIDFC